ncbi:MULTISPECIES: matrixin family metalloprotease [Lactobacillus]|uniref:Matrixin family metalloprotease n=1 Tax=Lactobacillus xujianguonis TaxID=2495899 RepID=A0A437SW89_9LACO|nr:MULTISPECIES: matrixin family metalloprotease [Lactobacillus]RVU71205.1 matrixin family metalloprotease [Lactobacillus xujianguonis]
MKNLKIRKLKTIMMSADITITSKVLEDSDGIWTEGEEWSIHGNLYEPKVAEIRINCTNLNHVSYPIYPAVVHELGHAIGILSHSHNSKSAMYKNLTGKNKSGKILNSDKQILHAIYSPAHIQFVKAYTTLNGFGF